MARRPGPILPRKGLPLAPRPEHVEYPIEDLPEGDGRPPSGARHLLLSEERRYLCPKIVWDAPDRGQLTFHETPIRDRCLWSIESKRVGHPVYFWDRLLVKTGTLIEYSDSYGRAIAVPFLLRSRSARVVVSEHSEHRWVPSGSLGRYRKVPALDRALVIFGLLTGP